ncbi:uncharacterized protein LOC106180108 [Lingula anatina]|uniref:Uncharacterized protein LOC106180108 n=1 Tax=Lingula anatina TaxID=7574 RepID=A0A1S3KAC7_LINAN|nr:uncharacterized protein LOC106180108 [Lingula anatina]|eukprot:XP_013419452.1 uncharacterized protein LOC106180108 [Lingula anatina]
MKAQLFVLIAATVAFASGRAPVLRAARSSDVAGDGRTYIVKVKDNADVNRVIMRGRVVLNRLMASGEEPSDADVGSRKMEIGNAKFFTIHANSRLLEALQDDDDIEFIEQDTLLYAAACVPIDNSGLWGLDRIDQRSGTRDQCFDPVGDGAGVDAFILDTGIDVAHSDFRTGRAVDFKDLYSAFSEPYGPSSSDGNGHGTHVASTVGGNTMGVARAVNLVAVKVLSDQGSGSTTGIIGAIEDVVAYARTSNRKGVINMSLGGTGSSINAASNAAVQAGVTVVAAAGNSNDDACGYSPAGASEVVCVAASTNQDAKASFSNYGSCVDIIAPGQSILGADANSGSGSVSLSGTSMAAPHVAGAVALFLGSSPNATPDDVKSWLYDGATMDVISGFPGSTQPTTAPPEHICCALDWDFCCPSSLVRPMATPNRFLFVGSDGSK